MKVDVELFHKIEGGVAVMRSKGLYRQVDLYSRGGGLYAKWSVGFLRLMGDRHTAKTDVAVEGVNLPPGYSVVGAYPDMEIRHHG